MEHAWVGPWALIEINDIERPLEGLHRIKITDHVSELVTVGFERAVSNQPNWNRIDIGSYVSVNIYLIRIKFVFWNTNLGIRFRFTFSVNTAYEKCRSHLTCATAPCQTSAWISFTVALISVILNTIVLVLCSQTHGLFQGGCCCFWSGLKLQPDIFTKTLLWVSYHPTMPLNRPIISLLHVICLSKKS
jgi:hypothetical protein